MRKNLIFLTLLISVLMVSVVSAGITGYLVSRGRGIADAGYTATLRGVDRSGTATISVTTPTGDIQVVSVKKGETATVGKATISASDLTTGTLLRKGRAKVEINVVPASELGVGPIPIPIGSGNGSGNSTGHTHLINYYTKDSLLDITPSLMSQALSSLGTWIIDPNENNPSQGIEANSQRGITKRRLSVNVKCNPGDIALGGYFSLSGIYLEDADYNVIQAGAFSSEYHLSVYDIFKDVNADGLNDAGIHQGYVSVNCAQIEQAIGSSEPHFSQ